MKEMKYIVKKQMIAGRPYIVIENNNGACGGELS